MYDLYAIILFQNLRQPVAAPDDILVEFNRQARSRKFQPHDQILQRELVRNFAGFAIDLNAQEPLLTSLTGMDDATCLAGKFARGGSDEEGRATRSELWYLSRNGGKSPAISLYRVDKRPKGRP